MHPDVNRCLFFTVQGNMKTPLKPPLQCEYMRRFGVTSCSVYGRQMCNTAITVNNCMWLSSELLDACREVLVLKFYRCRKTLDRRYLLHRPTLKKLLLSEVLIASGFGGPSFFRECQLGNKPSCMCVCV